MPLVPRKLINLTTITLRTPTTKVKRELRRNTHHFRFSKQSSSIDGGIIVVKFWLKSCFWLKLVVKFSATISVAVRVVIVEFWAILGLQWNVTSINQTRLKSHKIISNYFIWFFFFMERLSIAVDQARSEQVKTSLMNTWKWLFRRFQIHNHVL